MCRSRYFRIWKKYIICSLMISIYLVYSVKDNDTIALWKDDSIHQKHLFTKLCKTVLNSGDCEGQNRSNLFVNTRNTSSPPTQSDDLSYITLKPEVAIQLNSVNISERSLARTIDRPYLIENPELCTFVKNLTVLVIVHSAVGHLEHRRIIRKTWTNNSYFHELGTVRTLFLLGQGQSNRYKLQIENEFKRYGDLLQGDFIDAYRNMTHKNVMGYKWLSERCKNAKIILKVDDDVVINMFYFLKHFAQYFLSKRKHMACVRLSKILVKRKSKWAVDATLFHGYPYYPDYCQGFMVAISNDIIPALYKSASITPFFWIDDVFAYGMVSGNIPQIEYTGLEIGTDVAWKDSSAISCYERNAERCPYLVVLVKGKVQQKLKFIWYLMVKEHQKIFGDSSSTQSPINRLG